eukprot:RCo045237
MSQGAFLTEVNVLDEFKPPVTSGVRLVAPPLRNKDLIFPQVKPKKYVPDSPGQGFRIFGATRFARSGKRSLKNPPHLKSHNLLSHEIFILPATVPSCHSSQCSSEATEEKVRTDEASKGKETAALATPVRAGSSCSSSYSSGASSCACTHSTASRCSCSRTSSRCSRVRASSATPDGGKVPNTPSSSVHSATAFEGLVSVSQVPSRHSQRSQRSTPSEVSSAARAQLQKLEAQLEEERKHREQTQEQLALVQKRQEALLAQLKALGAA